MSIDNLDTTESKGSGGSDTAHTITEQLERLNVVLSSAPEQNNISQTRQPRQPEEIMSPVIPLDGSGDHVSEERSGGFAAILRRQEEDEQHAAAAWAEKQGDRVQSGRSQTTSASQPIQVRKSSLYPVSFTDGFGNEITEDDKRLLGYQRVQTQYARDVGERNHARLMVSAEQTLNARRAHREARRN
ncbi:hypothetical protein Q7P36_010800 [Cladosporium allicinum]